MAPGIDIVRYRLAYPFRQCGIEMVDAYVFPVRKFELTKMVFADTKLNDSSGCLLGLSIVFFHLDQGVHSSNSMALPVSDSTMGSGTVPLLVFPQLGPPDLSGRSELHLRKGIPSSWDRPNFWYRYWRYTIYLLGVKPEAPKGQIVSPNSAGRLA